jgi:hypothetical protein
VNQEAQLAAEAVARIPNANDSAVWVRFSKSISSLPAFLFFTLQVKLFFLVALFSPK